MSLYWIRSLRILSASTGKVISVIKSPEGRDEQLRDRIPSKLWILSIFCYCIHFNDSDKPACVLNNWEPASGISESTLPISRCDKQESIPVTIQPLLWTPVDHLVSKALIGTLIKNKKMLGTIFYTVCSPLNHMYSMLYNLWFVLTIISFGNSVCVCMCARSHKRACVCSSRKQQQQIRFT